jgi:serine acetyltransferase
MPLSSSPKPETVFRNTRFTDLPEAVPALSAFLHRDCQARFFEFEGTGPHPVNTCLCWHEYRSLPGILRASWRYSVLAAAYAQPFSGLKSAILRACGATIHRTAYLSPGVFIDPLFPSLLTIERGALLGVHVEIALHEHSGNLFRAGRVRIGEGAVIGAGARIACGVQIGAFARIGFSAVVLRDVPPGATVIGNPARILRLT